MAQLFRVTTPLGDTWLIWANSEEEAKNKASFRARHFNPIPSGLDPAIAETLRSSLSSENMTVQSGGNVLGGLQVGDQFIDSLQGAALGTLTGNNIQAFRDAVQGTGNFANQGLGDFNRLASFFGAGVGSSGGAISHDPPREAIYIGEGQYLDQPSPTTRQPGDPMITEEAMPSVAWERALQDIGMGGGLSRTIANPYKNALEAFADIGFAGNRQTPIFADLPEGRERQTIYTRALQNMMGGATGAQSGWSLSQAARNLFNEANPEYEGLKPFFDPVYWGDPDKGDVRTAMQLAELGLAGLGRGRFGSMGGYLPSAQRLVQDYGSQRVGGGESDLREYILGRLSPGTTGFVPA